MTRTNQLLAMRFRPIHRVTRSNQLILAHNTPQLECNSIAGSLACGEYDRKLPQPEQESKTSDLSVPGQSTIHAGSASVTLSRPNYYCIPLTTETETIGHHIPYVSSTTPPASHDSRSMSAGLTWKALCSTAPSTDSLIERGQIIHLNFKEIMLERSRTQIIS